MNECDSGAHLWSSLEMTFWAAVAVCRKLASVFAAYETRCYTRRWVDGLSGFEGSQWETLLIMCQFLHNAPLTPGTGSAFFLLPFSLCGPRARNLANSKKLCVDASLVGSNLNPNSFYIVWKENENLAGAALLPHSDPRLTTTAGMPLECRLKHLVSGQSWIHRM